VAITVDVSIFSFLNTARVDGPTMPTHYPVEFAIDTNNFPGIYAKTNPDGSDLAFSTKAIPIGEGELDVPHWIESWNPGGSSRVWIRLPTAGAYSPPIGPLAAVGPTLVTIYMFYGNPSPTNMNNRDATFTSRMISAGDWTVDTNNWETTTQLGGGTVWVPKGSLVDPIDWFELQPGHALNFSTSPRYPVYINARRIIVAGTLAGNAAGYSWGIDSNNRGDSPTTTGGGGGGGCCQGAGGGAYGGAGGAGGYDGSPTGAGGAVYGASSSTGIVMGAGGGTAGFTPVFGGAGGGAVRLFARDVAVSGQVELNGGDGSAAASGDGAGGGAGGGMLIWGREVSFGGTCEANGGDGTDAAASFNGGGGGGGGRAKLFYGSNGGSLTGSLTCSVDGGGGGAGDGTAPEDGAAGTTYTQATFWNDAELCDQGAEMASDQPAPPNPYASCVLIPD